MNISNNIKTDSETRLCFYCSHKLWKWNRQSVPKRRHINLRRRGITKIKNTTFITQRKF